MPGLKNACVVSLLCYLFRYTYAEEEDYEPYVDQFRYTYDYSNEYLPEEEDYEPYVDQFRYTYDYSNEYF